MNIIISESQYNKLFEYKTEEKQDELDEYSRTLKNARQQGVGLRFPKSVVKNIPNRFRPYNRTKMDETDPKVGTGKKPEGSGRRLYTDENPSDTVSVKFKTKEDIVNRIFNSVFRPKVNKEWGINLNLKISVDGWQADRWTYEFITYPNKFVLKNPNEDGWNENRYWSLSTLIRNILTEALEYSGIYGNNEFKISTSDNINTYSRFATYDKVSYEAESKNKDTLELNATLPSFIRDDYGGVTSKLSGINYNILLNGSIDDDMCFFLGDIENSDWWDGLDNGTKNDFIKYFG